MRGFYWGVGVAAGAALWGGCNWGNNTVNVNRYNSFNRTNISNGNWQHNAAHRGAVPYRDNASRQKYGQYDRQAAQARDQFRGREQGAALNDRAGLQNAANRGVGQGGGAGAANRDMNANRASAANRDMSANRGGNAGSGFGGNRAGGGGAFNTGNGAQTRDYSNRGNSSMSNRGSGGASASRGGGGASRSGGGDGASRGGGGGGGRR